MDNLIEFKKEIPLICETGPLKSGEPLRTFIQLKTRIQSKKIRKYYVLVFGKSHRLCANMFPDDSARGTGLGGWKIPVGLYVKRNIDKWTAEKIADGFDELKGSFEEDTSRPRFEFHASERQVVLFFPVLKKI